MVFSDPELSVTRSVVRYCLDCKQELSHAWLDYGRNHMRHCIDCDKYLVAKKMMTKKEVGL
tara:strand:- start:55 stop:237 length:183 start_codon:yes stop_codon:yes gene_type:complete